MEPRSPTHAAELNRQTERRARLSGTLAATCAGCSEITLEAGCGHGHWLTAYGMAHPGETCIGLDLLGERIDKARAKAARAGLSQVHFIKAELTEFLACLPDGLALGKIVFLFPDPWPKKRHFRRRMIQSEVLTALAGRAGSGCRLYFRTDSEAYFEWTRDLVDSHPEWTLPGGEEPWIFEQETVFQRKMERFQSLIAVRA